MNALTHAQTQYLLHSIRSGVCNMRCSDNSQSEIQSRVRVRARDRVRVKVKIRVCI